MKNFNWKTQKESKRKMWIFLVVFMFDGIRCFTTEDPFWYKASLKEQCFRLCNEEKIPTSMLKFKVGTLETFPMYFHHELEKNICQAGCRLFNIKFGGGLDVNPPLVHCQIGCERTFRGEEVNINICHIGCDRMASKVQNRIQRILVMTPHERIGHGMVRTEPDPDSVNTDDLFDPSIKSQLEIGFNVDYKIPETYIRTMPIEEKDQPTNLIQAKAKDTGDWLDCASKNSGIPRWILLSTMLGAIMVAIWLTLSMESRRGQEECDDEMLTEIPDEKEMENYVIEKDTALLENDAFKVASENDVVSVTFAPPPTYSEMNEIDNSEPPNYTDAVENQHKEEKA